MADFVPKDMTGTLFKNDRKNTDKHPDIRVVDGYPRYGVDAEGRVYTRTKDGWKLKNQITGANGYRCVSLWKDNRERRMYVHHLVLNAFVGERGPGQEALHADGSRTNNAISNLRWGTRAENVADMVKHGTATVGAKNAMAKLTRPDVLWLRDMRDMGFSAVEASRHFGVTPGTVRRVFSGETYREV